MAPEISPDTVPQTSPDTGPITMKEPLPEPDITGTQAHALEGWQERTEKLAKPEFFKVTINPSVELLKQLDNSQKVRLFTKLKLVSKAAQYMAAGMTKGTVKYATDDYEIKQWFAHLIGEGADQMCYQMLLFNAWHLQQQDTELLLKGVIGQEVTTATEKEGEYIVEHGGRDRAEDLAQGDADGDADEKNGRGEN